MKTNKTIIGFLGAAAVGAALGILFAPDKGTNTRKKIAKKTSETKEEIKSKIDQLKETLADKYNEALDKGEKIIENGQANIDNIKKINEKSIL
ncbi:YtxH domain-containing protein [Flavobacterium faecale]|uniref:YtxH domain-containing protein n=1 Tax=Flavobacterium faecale TaxID=1355330 RepID=UPI003AAA82FA